MTKLSIAMLLTTSFLLPRYVCAQEQRPAAKRLDIAATYSATRANVTDGTGFWAQGGGIDAGFAVAHNFGVAASVNGSHTGDAATSQSPFSLLTFTVGPRYSRTLPQKEKQKHAVDLFVQGLFGVAHEFDATLPSSATSASGFALQIGGGVNIAVTRSLAVRALEADWLRTQLPNAATGAQNSLRLAAGVVYRF